VILFSLKPFFFNSKSPQVVKAMFKPSLEKLFKLFVLVLCLDFAAARLTAQEAYQVTAIENPRCDLSEVPPLDPPPGGRFATILRDTPEAKGAIVVFNIQGRAEGYAQYVKERLVNFAGVSAQQLVTIYGGNSDNLRLELWIIPKGAAEPGSNFVEDWKTARQFDGYIYWDAEYCGGDRLSALAGFAKKLKEMTDWQGYIVIRPHINKRGVSIRNEGWDPDGNVSRQQALRRVTKDKRYLVKKFGLSAARLKAVVGEKDGWTHAELWLVPPGAEPPVSKAQRLTRKD
jgi:hypothetical protein